MRMEETDQRMRMRVEDDDLISSVERVEETNKEIVEINEEEKEENYCENMENAYREMTIFDDKKIEEDMFDGRRIANKGKKPRGGGNTTLSHPVSSLANIFNNFSFKNFTNLTTLMWIYATFFNHKGSFDNIFKFYEIIKDYLNPQIQIAIHEYDKGGYRNSFYGFIEGYLRDSASLKANKLRANGDRGSYNIALTIDEGESITDKFDGVEFTWCNHCRSEKNRSIRYYTLSFGRRYRDIVLENYLRNVVEESRILSLKNRKRRIFTNSINENKWSYVEFNHPANFTTLAMDLRKKREIMDDLTSFSNSKDYYAKMGKAWKRGYLLYGPPGTGKSTMIAAMANFLEYDIYDLELTAVKNNLALRALLTNTNNRSILVIEDIDCSLDVAGKRKAEEKKEIVKKDTKDGDGATDTMTVSAADTSIVTLSGLLNFIDGLWSTIGEERLVVFTTNHVEKLDPALIRRGRMDMHIELSYCTYEAFLVLAENYLQIDSHPLFSEVRELLKTRNITPADVAEVLICNTANRSIAFQVTERLEELIGVLEKILIIKEDKEKEAASNEFVLA